MTDSNLLERRHCAHECQVYRDEKFKSDCIFGRCVCRGLNYQFLTCLRKFILDFLFLWGKIRCKEFDIFFKFCDSVELPPFHRGHGKMICSTFSLLFLATEKVEDMIIGPN